MAEQPRNFGFGEDETMLRDSARKFFEDNYSPDKLHAMVAGDSDVDRPIEAVWNREHWKQIVDLGWPAACIPEAAGGIGMPLVAAMALAEEAGRAAFPSPLLSTMNASFVLAACDSDAANAALAEIATGKATTLALVDQAGSWDLDSPGVRMADGALTGTARFVQDAWKSEQFVVSAASDAGVGLYLVESGADGLEVIPDRIIDLTRDQATLQLDGVEATELVAPGQGSTVLEAALPAILSVVSADMVGSGEWLLQTTTEYAKTRVQFDRPLGFFQAVKHPLVDVMLAVDRARSLTYNAACATDHDPDSALRYARMAKSEASDMAVYASSRAVQFHGGIGFTWECYVHLFFKRQMHNAVLFGDARYQRALLAEELMGPIRLAS